jgi:hypothetical protein
VLLAEVAFPDSLQKGRVHAAYAVLVVIAEIDHVLGALPAPLAPKEHYGEREEKDQAGDQDKHIPDLAARS